MEKQVYITEEERAKCQKVADAFAELYEMEDIVVLDVGRYGFVMLKYYKPPYGFAEDETFTDSRALFEQLWEEWLHTKLYLMAKEMKLDDILYAALENGHVNPDTEDSIKSRLVAALFKFRFDE